MTLFKQQLRNELKSLLVWSLVLGGAMFGTTLMWKSMAQAGSLTAMEEIFQQLPQGVSSLFGGAANLSTLVGWFQGYAFSGVILLTILIYAALLTAGMLTREMDRRTIEFLLSLPVTRRQVVASRWTVLVAALAVLHLAHFLGLALAALAVGESPAWQDVAVTELNSWLLATAISSVLLAASVLVNDYGRGLGLTVGGTLGFFFADNALVQSTGFLQSMRNVLPLAFYQPATTLSGATIPWSDLGALAAISLAALWLAVRLFERKSIAV